MTNCNHKMNQKRPTIYAIDFDGTIVRNKWPEIGDPVKEVVDFILEIQEHDDEWILWTMREGEKLQEAIEWCIYNGLTPTAINDNVPRMKEFYHNNPRKVFANYYIDDHNAGGIVLPPLKDTKDEKTMLQSVWRQLDGITIKEGGGVDWAGGHPQEGGKNRRGVKKS